MSAEELRKIANKIIKLDGFQYDAHDWMDSRLLMAELAPQVAKALLESIKVIEAAKDLLDAPFCPVVGDDSAMVGAEQRLRDALENFNG